MDGTRAALAVTAAVVAVVAVAVRSWFARTDHLGLSLFRPWRGDGWPLGVQEEDEVHFDFRNFRTTADREASGPQAWAAIADDAPADLAVRFEDVTSGIAPVALERPGSVEVHRARR